MFRRGLTGVVSGWFLVAIAMGQPVVDAGHDGPVYITIRPEGATVRESVRAEFPGTEAVLRFAEIPVEAEPSSFIVRDRRREVRLLDWWTAGVTDRGMPVAERKGSAVALDFTREPAVAGPGWSARMQAAGAGRTSFDLIYRMTGLSWRVYYDVLVRGNPAGMTNPVAIDVEGWVEIDNRTARNFSNVHLVVTGPDTLGRVEPVKPPGFLELDEDNPMSDVWRFQPPDPLMPHRYVINKGLSLPAGRVTTIPYVQVARRPVERRLLIRAENIPTDTRQRGASPSMLLALENNREYAGGRAAPPGRAAIHLGSRATMFQEAWFKHTPARAEILIDMGVVPGVHVRRVTRGRIERVDGGYEQVYEIRIENTLDQSLQLVIDETPPFVQNWTLLRATQSHEMRDRRIIFTPTIRPRGEAVFQYTLRIL